MIWGSEVSRFLFVSQWENKTLNFMLFCTKTKASKIMKDQWIGTQTLPTLLVCLVSVCVRVCVYLMELLF